MTTAYFAGSEIPVYRELLHERGVKHVSLNWLNHQRRVKDKNWRIADCFPNGTHVFIDSGAAAYNRPAVNVSGDELTDLANRYYGFVEQNYESIDGYLEFDAKGLTGPNPAAFENVKCLPVWHSGEGADHLTEMASLFPSVAVGEHATQESELLKTYREAARATRLHLIGADRVLLDAQIKWHSCHFSAWYSAQQRGELFVWAGNQLRRYMPDRREDAIRRHRPLIESLGLDLSAVARGDGTENLKLSIWSWTQYFSNLDHVPPTEPVTRTPVSATQPNADPDPLTVAETDQEWRNDLVSQRDAERAQEAAVDRPRTLWPGLQATEHTVYALDPEDGVKKPRTELRIASGGLDVRSCTGCYLADACPEYSPGSKCAFNFTTQVSTKEQRQAARSFLSELQMGRVAFAAAAEQRDGGYPDKALSAEIDRAGRLLKDADDVESASFTLSIKANQSAGAQTGLLTRLFGRDAEPLPIENSGVVDAEVISDTAEARSDHVTERSG